MTRSNTASRSKTDNDIFKGMARNKSKDAKVVTPPEILVGEHGRYQIKSGRLAGEFVARAFPKPPTKARGLIAEATGATEEAAIAALHEVIDARENRRTDERRSDSRTGVPVPSTEEYIEAIRQIALSEPQRAILTALSLAGDEGLTEARMARMAGYKSPSSANRSFASAGLLIANYLSMDIAPGHTGGDPEGASLLGYRGERKGEDDPGNWILHAELREAVPIAL